MNKEFRCAIYTRKSSEEGLEQAFNSLEAQREACIAYIQSQKHEGWVPVPDKYDDGGFSGGNMERPALARLLDDIRSSKVQIVVVYKVDRLTRSLSDFAKIIDVFDSQQVSFVSVTQQFNTTTSMGRLTLNVLLSFAQFERELTGERIRDKIAASKKKGMWMGGTVPLGYRSLNHQLLINEQEAETVRGIYRQYLRTGSVCKLKADFDRRKVRSTVRSSTSGRTWGGTPYSRGALHQLLNNQVYIGKIVHRDQVYTGQHQPIIDQKLWNQVATQLKSNNQARRTAKPRPESSLLTGVLTDTNGVRFTPTCTNKNGKRYRYYTSQAAIQNKANQPEVAHYPAKEIETLVATQVQRLLGSLNIHIADSKDTPWSERLVERAKNLDRQWPTMTLSKRNEIMRSVVKAVMIGPKKLWVEVDWLKLQEALLGQSSDEMDALIPGTIKLSVDFHTVRRGAELQIHSPAHSLANGIPDAVLVKTVARARSWYDQLVSGEIAGVQELSKKTGLKGRSVRKILQCAILSPAITEAILAGRQARQITGRILVRKIPLSWRRQRQMFL